MHASSPVHRGPRPDPVGLERAVALHPLALEEENDCCALGERLHLFLERPDRVEARHVEKLRAALGLYRNLEGSLFAIPLLLSARHAPHVPRRHRIELLPDLLAARVVHHVELRRCL
jgi:hypothetical protein